MKRLLDLNTWPRKPHFDFFRQFEEPFFGITAEVNCAHAYEYCKATSSSFFLYYLHKSLVAANRIEPFRYRIEGDLVVVHDQVNASPTINRMDGTFGFGYMNYLEDFEEFSREAQAEIESVRSRNDLFPSTSGENVIHYSSLPWIKFTSISHARSFSFRDSVPKISFGKMTSESGWMKMPVSIHVHHALMDGWHVGMYLDMFQELMDGN